MTGIGKRNWLLVLAVAGLGIGYLLLLGYLLWGNLLSPTAAATAVSPTPTPALIDLWEAYRQARAAAQAQAEDAQLVSASTQWQAVGEEALLAGVDDWSFVFYSPESGDSLDIIVSAGAAQVVNQTPVWVAPRGMAEGAWRAGPRDALLVFLAHGGRAFLDEHPLAVVDLHLAGSDQGGPVWAIVALDPEERSLLSLLLDAETRQVLSN
jgi:hypothetical protein